jgi:hypothetical protein
VVHVTIDANTHPSTDERVPVTLNGRQIPLHENKLSSDETDSDDGFSSELDADGDFESGNNFQAPPPYKD